MKHDIGLLITRLFTTFISDLSKRVLFQVANQKLAKIGELYNPSLLELYCRPYVIEEI